MRFVLLGAGGQAALHASALQKIDDVELAGVASVTAARTRSFAERFATRAFSDALEALRFPDADAVILATPTATHADLACRAFAAGKHVFCETPLSLTLEEADRMIAAAAAADRVLRIGLIHRFDAENRHLHDLVRSEALGAPLSVMTSRLTAPFWLKPDEDPADRHHGDAIRELLAFDLDFIIWTFGMPRAVRAVAIGEVGRVTHVQVGLTFDGPIAQCEASQLLPTGFPFTLETRIIFERGSAECKMVFADDMEAIGPRVDYLIHRRGETAECPSLEQADPWVAQLRHFIRAVEDSADRTFADCGEARQALQVCLAVEEAVRTGGQVIL